MAPSSQDQEPPGNPARFIATWYTLGEAVPDTVEIPPEMDAERAVVLPALTRAGLRAKAELVRLLHGVDLVLAAECIKHRALASLCDDLTGARC